MAQPDTDVVIVGAGMAGLTAAVALHRLGRSVRVVEAGAAVGGRVRTDRIDGFALDRGFQVLLPAYPQVRAMLDVAALQPRAFPRGVTACTARGKRPLVSPLTRGVPSAQAAFALGRLALRAPRDVAALAAFSGRDVLAPQRVLGATDDRSIAEDLARWRLSSEVVRDVMRPFLAGVFLDPDLGGSARVMHLVWRCFIVGGAVLPAAGMQAVPEQLAAALPPGTVGLGRAVTALLSEADARGAQGVLLADGTRLTARAVLLATDGTDAAQLVGTAEPRWQGEVTVYYRAPGVPRPSPLIAVDGTGPYPLNAVMLSAVAPEYAPTGQCLVAAVLPGRAELDGTSEGQLRERLARVYDTATGDWEQLAVYRLPRALPFAPPGTPLRRSVRFAPGRYVCGDHRDTPSLQGAMVSGRRAARAIDHDLGR